MSAVKRSASLRPPMPRPQPQLWYAVYELPRKMFLDAVEEVVSQMPPPREGLHWEYEGFNRNSLFLLPVADNDDSSEFFQSVVFGFNVGGGRIHIYVESTINDKIRVFKELVTALGSLDYVTQACIEPCSMLDIHKDN